MRNQNVVVATVINAAMLASFASGQVVINEVFENPPGSTDNRWEFIELYGSPGTNLTGYAVLLVKGGVDANGDGIPDGGTVPEVDEAFTLDGIVIPASGFFTLVNGGALTSDVGNLFLTQNPSFNPILPDALQNRRWIDGISFPAVHIPSSDSAGNLENDGSSTYVLVRKRPLHSINGSGQSVYASGYAWRKDVNPDTNFDSVLDFGIAVGANGLRMQPYQMVDDLAWSNSGGKEYTRSDENEVSETPGFNPDGISRLRYFAQNPMLGHRTKDSSGGFEIESTTIADESFIYGEIVSIPNMEFNTGVDADGYIQVKAPTDPTAPGFDGSCDPEPDDVPGGNPGCVGSGGPYRFTDLNVAGFRMTPGSFNDHPTNAAIRQFRFVTADFTFDGVVDAADLALIQARLGATLDDTVPAVYDNGTPDDEGDDIDYTAWKWEGAQFQQLLMMRDMVKTDGPGGVNAAAVTQQDIDAVAALVPPVECPGDTNGDNVVNFADLNTILSQFGQSGQGLAGDLDGNMVVNFADLNEALSNFGLDCN